MIKSGGNCEPVRAGVEAGLTCSRNFMAFWAVLLLWRYFYFV